MRLDSTGRKSVATVLLLATAIAGFGLGAVVGVSWTKDEVVPVLLVKPHIGGFVPMEGSTIGNSWEKDAVRPVILVKPGIGSFVPVEGSSIGNNWPKDEVTPVMLVEPSIGTFVPLKLIVSDAEAVAPRRYRQELCIADGQAATLGCLIPSAKRTPAITSFRSVEPFNARQRFEALSINLNTIVRHAMRLPLPLVLS